MDDDNGTLKGFRDLLKKLHGDKVETSQADAIDPVVTSSDTAKGYADGGEVDPAFLAQLQQGIPGMTTPSPTPQLSDVTSTLNKTPDTNYDFYGPLAADKRNALYQQLLEKQNGGGNMIAQGVAGLGDAISNSFGGQHNSFQNDTQNIAAKNTENRIGAFDTQRGQKLQDMQGSQEMMMSDPKHPYAQGLRSVLHSKGIAAPSGMSASLLLKIFPSLGEMALKEATLAQGANQFNTSAGIRRDELSRQKSKDAEDTAARSAEEKRKNIEGLGKQGIIDQFMHPEVTAELKRGAGLSTPAPTAAFSDPQKEAKYQAWKSSQGR